MFSLFDLLFFLRVLFVGSGPDVEFDALNNMVFITAFPWLIVPVKMSRRALSTSLINAVKNNTTA